MTDPNVSLIPTRAAQSRTARIAFGICAAIGGIVLLTEVALHIVSASTSRTYELNHGVTLIGILFGFVGFYGLDPKRARDGGAFLVDSSVKIIRELPRFGRRSTDPVAVPKTATTVVATPVAPDPAVDPDKDESIERPQFRPGGLE